MTRFLKEARPNFGPEKLLPQGLPKFKRTLWGDKPEGLLPENCPNFSFFLFGPGPFRHLWQAPHGGLKRHDPTLGPEKLKFFQGNFALVVDRKGKFFQRISPYPLAQSAVVNKTNKNSHRTLKGSKLCFGSSDLTKYVEELLFIWLDPSIQQSSLYSQPITCLFKVVYEDLGMIFPRFKFFWFNQSFKQVKQKTIWSFTNSSFKSNSFYRTECSNLIRVLLSRWYFWPIF
jgi:hypothetical protein